VDLVWAFNGDLELEVRHVLALTEAEGVVEQLLFQLRNLRANVAVLVIPLVNRGAGGVSGELVLTVGLLDVVVDGDGANPAGLLSLVLEGDLVGLVEGAGKSGGAESVLVTVTRVLRDCDAVAGATGLPISHGGRLCAGCDGYCSVVGVASTEGRRSCVMRAGDGVDERWRLLGGGKKCDVREVFYHRRRECQARAWSRACEEGATDNIESELNELAHAFQVSFCSCKSVDDRGLLEVHVVG
jgi:hypothetical protein